MTDRLEAIEFYKKPIELWDKFRNDFETLMRPTLWKQLSF